QKQASLGMCKVCVLSVSNFCVCLPCVVTCLFPCLVLVLPCSRHRLSLCLFPVFSSVFSFAVPPLLFSPVPRYLLCVSIVHVFLFLVAFSSLYVTLVCSLCFLVFPRVSSDWRFLLVKLIYLCLYNDYSPAYSLFGFVCLLLDCLPVYRTLLVNDYSSLYCMNSESCV